MSLVAEADHRSEAPAGTVGRRVGIIVSVHDTDRSRLGRCVDSLFRTDADLNSDLNSDLAVVVVDNSGRSDPMSDDRVTWVSTENQGFGAAVNHGAAHPSVADRELVVALNDDVEATEGWLAPLVAALDGDPQLGAVQPRLLLAGTDPVLVNSLGVEPDEQGAWSDIGYRTPAESETGSAPAEPRSIAAFTGGAVVFRRTFFDEVGGFDDRYFLYYEDVDLALRGAELGWSYACVPASSVVHAKGATTDAMSDDARRLQERNRLVIAARFSPLRVIGRALWLSTRRLRHRPRLVHARALLGGLVRMPRAFVERSRAGRRPAPASRHGSVA